jgi:heme/copper-type cytochrome/quinol oxidase subunit 2
MEYLKSWSRLHRISRQFRAVALFSVLFSSCNQEPEALLEIPDPLEIKVVGSDFYWHFLYPGSDQAFGTDDDFSVSKDLYVPLGCAVKLLVTSEDYIYFFRVPDFGLRESAIPDLIHEINFAPNHTGVSELEVDPMCSAWDMHKDGSMGNMHILSEDDFKNWQKKQLSGR